MSGSAKSTDTKTNTSNSTQNEVRMPSDVRTDRGDRQVSEPHYSRLRGNRRNRPPREETRKFHLAALLWLSVISLLLVPMATLLDIPIARWCQADALPEEVSKMLDLSLIYAHGSGIFLILVAILMMAPTKRWKMPRLATLALGSGAVATLVKMFVLRPRPNSLRLDLATNEHAWIWSFDWTLSRIAEYDAGMRAFPSGYLATATALTVGLWIVVPRGRPLFLAFCIGTMLQRMYCGSHFLSDLFGSAAVGLGWCYICYHPKLIGNVFDKMEAVQQPKRRNANMDESSFALPSPKLTANANQGRTPSISPTPSFTKAPLPPGIAAQRPLPSSNTGAPSGTLPQNIGRHASDPRTTIASNDQTTRLPRNANKDSQSRPADGGEPKAA
jgi:membrane-associated phospholipid phosphatase